MDNSPKPHCIKVRRAKEDDFESVLEINRNVYEGCDYIPLLFKDLINDPDYSYYVVEVDGEVAAFEGVVTLDEGKTLMTRSARVKEAFNGMGLLKHIKKRIYEDYKDLPAKKRLRTSCNNTVRLVDSETFRHENRIVLRREILIAEVTIKDLVTSVPSSQDSAKQIELPELARLLETEHVKHFLFPDNIVTAQAYFFDASGASLTFLEKLSPHIVITHPLFEFLHSSVTTDLQSGKRGDDPCSCGLIGIGTHYFCPYGMLYSLDIFGTPSEGNVEDEIQALIRNHVEHLLDVSQHQKQAQKVLFLLSLTEGASKELFKNALIPLGFGMAALNSKYIYQYYFEQDFEKLVE